jgi:CTP:molybdopterin cytidylyltransferase MocA
MEAIVMAAGEGSRLRPLTYVWAKPVLPIDGRPVIGTLLRELAASGLAGVTVVTGHLAEQVEALVGDGCAFGVGVRFVRQPRPEGSADAVRRALDGGARLPALVTAADTAFTPGDLWLFLDAWRGSGATGALAVRRDPPPSRHRPPVGIRDGLVERVVDQDPVNPLGSAPLWALGPELDPFVRGVGGPPFELAAAVQAGIDEGLRVVAVEIGRTRDLTRPPDLVRENFPYLGPVTR